MFELVLLILSVKSNVQIGAEFKSVSLNFSPDSVGTEATYELTFVPASNTPANS